MAFTACEFYATFRYKLASSLHQAAVEGDQKQRQAGTKNGLQAVIKAKQRKEASGKSVSQIQASSDANTHNSKHKLRGGGREKQPEQKQGVKRMPKTRVHSTLCKVPARSQPTLTTQELQFYSWSRELMIFKFSFLPFQIMNVPLTCWVMFINVTVICSDGSPFLAKPAYWQRMPVILLIFTWM